MQIWLKWWEPIIHITGELKLPPEKIDFERYSCDWTRKKDCELFIVTFEQHRKRDYWVITSLLSFQNPKSYDYGPNRDARLNSWWAWWGWEPRKIDITRAGASFSSSGVSGRGVASQNKSRFKLTGTKQQLWGRLQSYKIHRSKTDLWLHFEDLWLQFEMTDSE